MKLLIVGLVALLVVTAGCGASKQFVSDEIAAAEARTEVKIGSVQDKADANASEVARLQQLQTALEEKADMALNKAEGFENYQVIWSGDIKFSYDSYEVDGVAASILDDAGVQMENNRGALMELTGHTDGAGSSKYNLLLGEKRAESARRYLADKFGISLYRMFVLSFGEDKPVALPDERNASSQNRRVTLTLWGPM